MGRTASTLLAASLTVNVALILCGLAFVLLGSSQQTPQIPPQQQTESAIGSQHEAQQQNEASDKSAAIVPTSPSGNKQKERAPSTDESAEKGTEFWSPLSGYKFKITDSLLALFTFLLVVAGAWQGIHLRRTVIATRNLAQATVGLELPKLRVMDAFIGEATRIPDNRAERIEKPYVAVVVANFGKTPAFITDWVINVRIGASLPDPPQFQGAVRRERDLEMPVLATGKRVFLEEKEFSEYAPTKEQIAGLLNGTTDHFLFIYGLIVFEDYEGHDYERGFALIWNPGNPEIEGYTEGCMTWDQEGYNYQDRVKRRSYEKWYRLVR